MLTIAPDAFVAFAIAAAAAPAAPLLTSHHLLYYYYCVLIDIFNPVGDLFNSCLLLCQFLHLCHLFAEGSDSGLDRTGS